jgi:predicted TIM-barrel fold metal-dependent hydrolase
MTMDELIFVSLDDHVVEPPGMYDQHLTAAQKAFAPTFHIDPDGRDYWLYDGKRLENFTMNCVVGRPQAQYSFEPIALSQMRAGCYDLGARVDDMNADGALAALCFPSIVRFDGSVFLDYADKAQALALLRAYNDWHIDEWCAGAPGRFIPNALVPTWDMQATVAEIERVRAKGCRSVSLTDNPARRGLPSLHSDYWTPFWNACADNGVVITMHHASGNRVPHPSPDSPVDAWLTCMPMSISLALADLLHLEPLRRLKDLKFTLVTAGTSWIPFVLRRADAMAAGKGRWTHADFGGRRPSDIFREHFLCTTMDRDGPFDDLDYLGAYTVCYENDYPHSDSQWPRSAEAFWAAAKGLSDEQVDRITHRNALEAYSFDAFGPMGGRNNCTVGALRQRASHVDTREQPIPGYKGTAATGSFGRVTSADLMRLMG